MEYSCYNTSLFSICEIYCITIESVPQPGRHGDTQTNKQLNRDDWGLTKLLSTGD